MYHNNPLILSRSASKKNEPYFTTDKAYCLRLIICRLY